MEKETKKKEDLKREKKEHLCDNPDPLRRDLDRIGPDSGRISGRIGPDSGPIRPESRRGDRVWPAPKSIPLLISFLFSFLAITVLAILFSSTFHDPLTYLQFFFSAIQFNGPKESRLFFLSAPFLGDSPENRRLSDSRLAAAQ